MCIPSSQAKAKRNKCVAYPFIYRNVKKAGMRTRFTKKNKNACPVLKTDIIKGADTWKKMPRHHAGAGAFRLVLFV